MQTEYGAAAAVPQRAERWLEMAATMTLTEIGRREGLTRERVRQVLSALGFVRRKIARRACVHCAGPVFAPRGNFCAAPECRRAYARAYARARRPSSRAPRAVCGHCNATLRRPARADGKPSFCADKPACKAARQLWRYHNEPVHRAYAEHYRRSEHGLEVNRRAKARYLASKRGVEWLAKRAERQRRRREEAAREGAAARQQRREARSVARAAAQARRAASEAAAAARVQEALRLSRAERLSERAIAAQLGVSRTTVYAWLHGQRRASALTSATR